jgi:peroxiredoxin Q/BCP
MLELREFRAHYPEYEEAGVAIAGICRDKPASNLVWSQRMRLPYPVLSDQSGEAARALRVTRQFGIGGWTIDMVRRTTLLVDVDGTIAAVWGKVKVRGHAPDVLRHARALLARPRA